MKLIRPAVVTGALSTIAVAAMAWEPPPPRPWILPVVSPGLSQSKQLNLQLADLRRAAEQSRQLQESLKSDRRKPAECDTQATTEPPAKRRLTAQE